MRFIKLTSILLLLTVGLFVMSHGTTGYAQGVEPSEPLQADYSALIEKARNNGTVMLLVGLDLTSFHSGGAPHSKEGLLAQREAISNAQQTLLNSLSGYNVQAYAIYETIPYMGLKVDEAALHALIASPLVTSIQEDSAVPPTDGGTSDVAAPGSWDSTTSAEVPVTSESTTEVPVTSENIPESTTDAPTDQPSAESSDKKGRCQQYTEYKSDQ